MSDLVTSIGHRKTAARESVVTSGSFRSSGGASINWALTGCYRSALQAHPFFVGIASKAWRIRHPNEPRCHFSSLRGLAVTGSGRVFYGRLLFGWGARAIEREAPPLKQKRPDVGPPTIRSDAEFLEAHFRPKSPDTATSKTPKTSGF